MPANFDPTSIPGLSAKAKEAVGAVFEAMTAWQNEATEVAEKNRKQVLDKMAKATVAMGWPEQIVEAARAQMQAAADMQGKTIEHIKAAWEAQLQTPNPMAASPEAMLSRLKSMPGFGSATNWPNAEALQAAATAPLAAWMEFGKQWQKFWIDALEKTKRG
jgi:hypothetical protein